MAESSSPSDFQIWFRLRSMLHPPSALQHYTPGQCCFLDVKVAKKLCTTPQNYKVHNARKCCKAISSLLSVERKRHLRACSERPREAVFENRVPGTMHAALWSLCMPMVPMARSPSVYLADLASQVQSSKQMLNFSRVVL